MKDKDVYLDISEVLKVLSEVSVGSIINFKDEFNRKKVFRCKLISVEDLESKVEASKQHE